MNNEQRHYAPSSQEVDATPPAIFNDPSLGWIAYAETRRTHGGMTGNLSDRSSTISPEGHLLAKSPLAYDQWKNEEIHNVRMRHQIALAKLSLNDISYPYPIHGTDLLSVTLPPTTTSITQIAESRLKADAVLVRSAGLASAITPADCPIINLANTKERSTLQIHAGYVGLEAGVIGKVLHEVSSPHQSEYLCYVSPFAQSGFAVHGPVLERLEKNPYTNEFIHQNNTGHVLDLGGAVLRQLLDAGIREQHIQISQADTLTDDTLFSHRNHAIKNAAGRNGIILGIRQ